MPFSVVAKNFLKIFWIGQSDYEFKNHPIIAFDFSRIDHQTPEILTQELHDTIDDYAHKYSINLIRQGLAARFSELIIALGNTLGPVIIIIDEYDKPIVDHIDNLDLAERSRRILRDFYGALKAAEVDAVMHFLFITGVTKFAKVALFSELNNLYDLTNNTQATALVGYTDQEVDHYLTEHIQIFANAQQELYEQTRQTLKSWYNGYRFSPADVTVYNPFSLHNCLAQKLLANYWFSSGTTNFLMKFIKKNSHIADEIETIEGSFYAASNLEKFTPDLYYQNYRTLFLQTGYLTFISGYDAGRRGYLIGYPNEEVRYSMTEQIMEFAEGITPDQFGEFGNRFREALAADDIGLFCKHLQDFIKLVPHNIRIKREKFYQQIFFMVCVLFGKRPATEVATEEGFMDVLVEGTANTFVIEMKRNKTPAVALKQIEKKRYWEPFEILKTKEIVLVGITFNETTDKGVEVKWKTKML